VIGLAGTWAYSLFPLTEQDHGERVAKLAVAMPKVK